MKLTEYDGCKYTISSGGGGNWLRSISIPLAEALEQSGNEDGSIQFADELPDYLAVDSRPVADCTILIGGVVGVFVFFASSLAKKILDDVYEAKFQPAIRKVLGVADKELSGANASKPKMFQLGISYADKKVFILIGIVGDTFDEILESESMIKTIHRNAVAWIDRNGVQQSIHLYVLKHGSINLEPELFENLQLAHDYIHKINLGKSEA